MCLRSSGMLRSVVCYLVTDVSGQRIGSETFVTNYQSYGAQHSRRAKASTTEHRKIGTRMELTGSRISELGTR